MSIAPQSVRNPDILVLDADERPLMVVETKDRVLTPRSFNMARDRLAAYQRIHAVPYGMLADLDHIHLFDFETENSATILATIPTREMLAFYDPDFSEKEIYGSYLTALIEAWLRDLAYHWKSPMPPGQETLDKLGLLSKLRNGWTVDKDALDAKAIP